MTPTAEATNIHDLALDAFRHLKELERSPARAQHIFRMICAVEHPAAGLLDAAGVKDALEEIESAAQFCLPE